MSRRPYVTSPADASSLAAIVPDATAWVPVRAPRLEVRWFVAGDLDRQARPTAQSVHRVDAYHVATLSPHLSIKRRGDADRLEAKSRSRSEAVTIGDTDGIAEHWQKWRLRSDGDNELTGPWVPVAKQIWSLAGLEVARVVVGEQRWWSVAFPLSRQRLPLDPPLADRWLSHVNGAAVSASYSSWLLERLNELDVT